MLNSKAIGNIGEAAFILECAKNNIPVFQDVFNNNDYDFVIEVKGKLFKVQVKTTNSMSSATSVYFDFRKTAHNNSKMTAGFYQEDSMDFMYCYDMIHNKSWLFGFGDLPKRGITIAIPESGKLSPNQKTYENNLGFSILT